MSSLTEKVVATLSDEIRRGALRPGDRIPTEVAMMKQLSVSRSVVREAISRLQAANVVETRHGIGTFVLAPAAEKPVQLAAADLTSMLDVMAIIEFRIDVEAAAAALAAHGALNRTSSRFARRWGASSPNSNAAAPIRSRTTSNSICRLRARAATAISSTYSASSAAQ